MAGVEGGSLTDVAGGPQRYTRQDVPLKKIIFYYLSLCVFPPSSLNLFVIISFFRLVGEREGRRCKKNPNLLSSCLGQIFQIKHQFINSYPALFFAKSQHLFLMAVLVFQFSLVMWIFKYEKELLICLAGAGELDLIKG